MSFLIYTVSKLEREAEPSCTQYGTIMMARSDPMRGSEEFLGRQTNQISRQVSC